MDMYPLTIRLDDELMKVVKVQASLTRSSLGSVVVDAARQALMPEYQQKQERVLLKHLKPLESKAVAEIDGRYRSRLAEQPPEDDVELFD